MKTFGYNDNNMLNLVVNSFAKDNTGIGKYTVNIEWKYRNEKTKRGRLTIEGVGTPTKSCILINAMLAVVPDDICDSDDDYFFNLLSDASDVDSLYYADAFEQLQEHMFGVE